MTNPRARGLVALWLFNEGVGALVNDAVWRGNSGIFAATAPSWTSGKYDFALSFDGSDDYVTFPGVMPVDITAPWTMTGLVTPRGTGIYPVAFGFYQTGGGTLEHIGLGLNSGTYALKVISNGETPGSGTLLTAGTRYHFGLVYDGSKFYAYLNGAEDYNVTPTGSDWQNCNEVQVGWDHCFNAPGNHATWNGDVEYVAVHDYALTALAVKQLASDPFHVIEQARPPFVVPTVAVTTHQRHIGFRPIEGAERLRNPLRAG